MNEPITENNIGEILKKETVHHVLARSYFTYLLGITFGLLMKNVAPLPYHFPHSQAVGVFVLMLGTFFIVWAQGTSRKSKMHRHDNQTEDYMVEALMRGPYKYFRSPTHIGLFFMSLSLGLISYSLWIVVISCALFLITRYTFICREENMLVKKYGNAYERYKKMVRI